MPKVTWFQYRDVMRLDYRYDVTRCPDVIYLKEQSQCAKDYIRIPVENGIVKLISWLSLHIEFENKINCDVHLQLYLSTGQKDVVKLSANNTYALDTLPPIQALVFDTNTGQFIDGWILYASARITINHRHARSLISWQTGTIHQLRLQAEDAYQMRLSHAKRHYNMLTQPLKIQNITKNGFLKKRIPRDIFEVLKSFYNLNKDNFEMEYYPKFFSFWNLNEVNITQVTLKEEQATQISDRLRGELEAWCQCDLEETKGEGIVTRVRRYPRNSVVRFHVDELQSGHILGAILHLARDLDQGSDWPLEVVDFHGERKRMTMEPGDMVLFESSKVIHGRPEPLPGDYYVNVFFYYRPKSYPGIWTMMNDAYSNAQAKWEL